MLAVLWLTAALSAVAFTVAQSVRGETERASTTADGVRAYYLAAGAVERALLYMSWMQYRNPDNTARYYEPGTPRLRFDFPAGEAWVEIIPETSKLNVNLISRDDLLRLLLALGVEPPRAAVIAAAIVDWRTPSPVNTSFDAYYLSLTPSFRARHASIEEIEELLLVQGMTPEIYYGRYDRDAEGNLIPRPGLRDCLSVYGTVGALDINTAEPPTMMAVGVPPDLIANIVARRRVAPFRVQDMPNLRQMSPALQRLSIAAGTLFTVRATARLRLSDASYSDLRRSVAALVKLTWNSATERPYTVLRWYDIVSPDTSANRVQ